MIDQTSKLEVDKFVTAVAGSDRGRVRVAAEVLSITPSLLSMMMKGDRAVSPELALRMERYAAETSTKVDKSVLVWGAHA